MPVGYSGQWLITFSVYLKVKVIKNVKPFPLFNKKNKKNQPQFLREWGESALFYPCMVQCSSCSSQNCKWALRLIGTFLLLLSSAIRKKQLSDRDCNTLLLLQPLSAIINRKNIFLLIMFLHTHTHIPMYLFCFPFPSIFPGTTCLIALLSDKELTVANVGDSRGVLCDKDGNAIPLSHDHKPYQLKERKRIKRAGEW